MARCAQRAVAGIEPPDPARALDGDDPCPGVCAGGTTLAERERVALGHEPLAVTPDHAMQEEPPWRRLVTDHVAHPNLVSGSAAVTTATSPSRMKGIMLPPRALIFRRPPCRKSCPATSTSRCTSSHDRIHDRKCRRFLNGGGYHPRMRGWRMAPYTLLWAAARALELAGRAAMYLAAGTLRLHDLRAAIGRAWAKFGRNEHAILSGLMSWEEALYGRFLKPDDQIFLIGCGTGRDLIALLKRGHRVTGLDPAPGRAWPSPGRCSPRKASRPSCTPALSKPSRRAGSFDAFIFSWYCYGYIPQAGNRIAVLGKLKAHLNPGGRILISYLPAEASAPRACPSA